MGVHVVRLKLKHWLVLKRVAKVESIMKKPLKVKNKAQPAKGLKTTAMKKSATASNDKDSKEKLATLSLDEFINSESENDSQSENGSLDEENGDFDEDLGDEDLGDEEDGFDEEDESEEDSDDENGEKSQVKNHKETLKKMKEIDPDFYN